jgi:predicted NUDIX family phosphoesterase
VSEKVMVIPRSLLFPSADDSFYGFRQDREQLWERISQGYRFMDREKAEGNHDYKQPIPYLILRYRENIFLYRRIGATTEKRLLQQYSLGVGGHINPSGQGSFRDLICRNLQRELQEEVSLRRPYSYHLLGYLNDETNDVGSDHLALIFLVSCSSADITVRERNKLIGRLIPAAQAGSYRSQLESWSILLLPLIEQIFSGH